MAPRILFGQVTVFTFVLAALPSLAQAQLIDVDFDSPPSSENNGGVYQGSRGSLVLDVRNGSPTNMFDHVTGGECWGGSGGCAKFYAGTTTGSGKYRGFVPGNYSGGNTRLNLRYLMKWNSGYHNTEGFKGDYLTMGGSPFWTQQKGLAAVFGDFQLTQSYRGTLYYIHGNGQSQSTCNGEGYECSEYEPQSNLGPGVESAGPFEYARFDNQWVCVELEMISSGVFRMYIWTRDGRYRGMYMEALNAPTGAPSIDGFSGMYFTDAAAPNGTYVMLDEVVLSDSFIGPPPGFLSDDFPPSPPTDVTITGS